MEITNVGTVGHIDHGKSVGVRLIKELMRRKAVAGISKAVQVGLSSAYATYERCLNLPTGGDKERLLAACIKRERKAAKAIRTRPDLRVQ